VEAIDHKEYRQQIYAAKDINGISSLHKVAGANVVITITKIAETCDIDPRFDYQKQKSFYQENIVTLGQGLLTKAQNFLPE
jgi:hypothetical protein